MEHLGQIRSYEGQKNYCTAYRSMYSYSLFNFLEKTFGLNEKSVVLNLVSGTGQLAFGLAEKVREVYAVDPRAKMIMGCQKCTPYTNIVWRCEALEKIHELKRQFHLTVISRSLLKFDREYILAQLHDMTYDGGGIAIVGNSATPTSWGNNVNECVKRWTYPMAKKEPKGPRYILLKEQEIELLKASHFTNVHENKFNYMVKSSVDQFIESLYTMPSCSPEIVGKNRGRFESEIRSILTNSDNQNILKTQVTTKVLYAFKQ